MGKSLDLFSTEGISCLYTLSLKRAGNIADSTPISSPADGYKLIVPLFQDADRELFVILALDARNRAIGTNIVSVGSVSASIVHPREVFKFAILANASGLILAHNHPSGDSSPSKDDIELTRRLGKCGEIMGIEILDHLIYGVEWYSMKEKGIIP